MWSKVILILFLAQNVYEGLIFIIRAESILETSNVNQWYTSFQFIQLNGQYGSAISKCLLGIAVFDFASEI